MKILFSEIIRISLSKSIYLLKFNQQAFKDVTNNNAPYLFVCDNLLIDNSKLPLIDEQKQA